MSKEPTDINKTDPKAVLAKAYAEIEKEDVEKAVKLLKSKLREKKEAETVLRNVEREIKDLELRIEQGNV